MWYIGASLEYDFVYAYNPRDQGTRYAIVLSDDQPIAVSSFDTYWSKMPYTWVMVFDLKWLKRLFSGRCRLKLENPNTGSKCLVNVYKYTFIDVSFKLKFI